MKVLQGYRYSVTANEEVTVTDENGLNLTCPAGQQTYFTATCDEVEVSGDAVVTQARGHITIGSGGGGGEKIAPGEVVLGGKNGSQVIEDVTTMTDGNYQFYKKRYLEEWDFDMPALTTGSSMFRYCSKLTSFTGDLSALTNGGDMFSNCSSLTSFSGDLSALTTGTNMFSNCTSLTSFTGDLSALTGGTYMFYSCSNLTSFTGDLSALTNGTFMFYGCKLDLASVQRIVTTVPTYTSGSHSIHIGVDSTKVSQDQQNSANTILVGKGWTVTWQQR